MRQETFLRARDEWIATPKPARLARPACLRDPAALARASSDLAKTIDACGPTLPSFLSLTDEPSATRGTNPIDWCRDATCDAGFAAFLADRWGSETAARDVWASRWPEGGAPEPVDTDTARRALFHEALPAATLAQWHDTRAYADAAFARALKALAAEARRLRPGLRVALLGAPMPSAFGGFDWEQIGQTFDVVEPYDWGACHDLSRSFAPHASTYHTLIPGREGGPPLEHEIWRYFLRGDRGTILFHASAWTRADAAGRTPLSAIAPLLAFLEGDALAAFRRGSPFRPQVAIVHGMASTRLHWLLDTRYDGKSWIHRLSSFDAAESSEARNREAWAALLSDLGLSYRFVNPAQIREGALQGDGIAAVVLPRAIALSDAEVAAIATAAKSRLLVADCQLGLYNQRLQRRDQPALDALFGIARPKARGVDDVDTRKPDSRPGAPLVPAEPGITATTATATFTAGGSPLGLVRSSGAGRTAYLNLRIDGYVDARTRDPAAAERLRSILRPLFVAARVRPRFDAATIDAGPPAPLFVHARRFERDIVIAVELNATTGARPVDWEAIGTAPRRVRITLPGTYRVEDVWSKTPLGPLNAIETEVAATRPALFRLTP